MGFRYALVGATLAALVLACGGVTPTPSPTPPPVAIAPTTSSATEAPPAASPAPSPSLPTGFAFDAESVVGYYAGIGYTCAAPAPSALADGYSFTSCELVDGDGRTLAIGVVTDPEDELADGFASVSGAASEPVLEPAAAFEPLAGFLGAMLGDVRGESLLEWLASHHGEDYAETTIGDLQVATYVRGGDHSTLYVELATQAYLDAPAPSGRP